MNDLLPSESNISLVRIDNERGILRYGLDELSLQIGGKAAAREFPIYLVLRDGHVCGFFHALQRLCIFPALHPEAMSPREFIKMVRSLSTEMKRHVGNPVFLLCEKAEELGEKHMELMRLKKMKEVAYEYFEGSD